MANPRRGEITVELNDRQWTLCLTLGALAELEDYFHVDDLPKLAEILSAGKFSSADLMAIIQAGLKGGGHDISRQDISEMRCTDGAAGFARIVADLLIASFGTSDS
ncbi:MAG: gene transfer agent family protein [Salaquimonas sp.]